MDEGTYTIERADIARGMTIIASGATRAAAVGAALTGLLAVAYTGRDDALDDATLAVPIRAEQPDLASLVQDLAVRLADEIAEQAAPVTMIRLDGLLRTDVGLTAWGYAFVAPGAGPSPTLPAVASVSTTEEGGETTVTLMLLSAPSGMLP